MNIQEDLCLAWGNARFREYVVRDVRLNDWDEALGRRMRAMAEETLICAGQLLESCTQRIEASWAVLCAVSFLKPSLYLPAHLEP